MSKISIFKIALAWGLLLSLAVCCLQAASQKKLSDKMVRLHVIANSDSEEDQEVKLKVRDAVLKCEVGRYPDESTLEKIRIAADMCLGENGFCQKSEVTFEKEYFETRDYEDFSLPAGYYDAVKVVIGKGMGHNWWCVIYPALCSDLAEAEEKGSFTEEEMSFITRKNKKYKIKFKLQEIISGIAREFF